MVSIRTNKYMNKYNINDSMELITENDIKNLKMSIGYKRKNGMINIKDYSTYKDFEKVFNKMPKSKSLVKGVETTVFLISVYNLTKDKSSLPNNYTEKELMSYFEFINKYFKTAKESKNIVILQTRYSKGKNKTVIAVYYDNPVLKKEATALILTEFVQ
jgi:hypothetical protein